VIRCHAATVVCALSIAAAGTQDRQERPVFRAAADSVTVDVSVRAGNRPVAGLTATDFVVTDNGVRQQVEILNLEALPIDVTVVLDISGSMRTMIGPMEHYARGVLALLRPDDRLRLITVGTDVRQVFGFLAPGDAPRIADIIPGEMTSIYDGIVAALSRPREGERRQVTIVVSDGIDTTSVLSKDRLVDISRRAESPLYVVIPEDPGVAFPTRRSPHDTRRRWFAPTAAPQWMDLIEPAANTGGEWERVYASPSGLPPLIRTVLDKFRTAYVLRYRPAGVAREGWHEIDVKVPTHVGVSVRARKGYFVESSK
jgi:VWFA-related protein